MNPFTTRMITVTAFCVVALVARANGLDHPGTAFGPHRAALMVSVIMEARRAAPPLEPAPHHARAVQFVERTRFSETERAQLVAFHHRFVAQWQAPLPGEIACPLAQRYAQRILDRLIEGSRLRQAVQDADFPMQVVVTCGVADFPDAEIKAGMLEISAELILALSSEDEIAAMMGHELAHYTLAHEAQKLQTHWRLTRYAARVQSINHEIEADTEGLILLANAGYDPHAAVDALKVIRTIMHARGWQSNSGHPDIDERIGRLTQEIARAGLEQVPRRTLGLAAVHDEIKNRPRALLKKREEAASSF